MIRYNLQCESKHQFEIWFSGSEACEEQMQAGMICCPECGSAEVSKSFMTPNVSTSRQKRGDKHALSSGEIREEVRKLHRHIEANSDDVGREFPTEARRIHDGEAEERAIRGQATPEEAKALIEDGVKIAPIPMLPDKMN